MTRAELNPIGGANVLRWLRNSVSVTALIAAAPALAGEAMVVANQVPTDVFGLGQIETVTITGAPLSQAISKSTMSAEEIYRFNALTIDRAIDPTAGAVSATTGGRATSGCSSSAASTGSSRR